MIPLLIGLAAASSLAALNRRRISRAAGRQYAERYPANANGIVEGAEAFVLPGTTGRGLLLLHGSGDSPQSLRYLATALNAAGYEVHAPLLPGHGRSPRAFGEATAADYYRAVREKLDIVVSQNSWTGVVGLSMGGALATRVVSERSDIGALVLLAPYLVPPAAIRATNRMSLLWSLVVPFVAARGENSIHDPVAREENRAYGTSSRGALAALVATADAGFRALRNVTAPMLVVNSLQDNRIPRELAERVVKEITAPLEQHWLEGCGHVITVDYCKDKVVSLVLTFLARHAG